jgi:hypothetical protein
VSVEVGFAEELNLLNAFEFLTLSGTNDPLGRALLGLTTLLLLWLLLDVRAESICRGNETEFDATEDRGAFVVVLVASL